MKQEKRTAVCCLLWDMLVVSVRTTLLVKAVRGICSCYRNYFHFSDGHIFFLSALSDTEKTWPEPDLRISLSAHQGLLRLPPPKVRGKIPLNLLLLLPPRSFLSKSRPNYSSMRSSTLPILYNKSWSWRYLRMLAAAVFGSDTWKQREKRGGGGGRSIFLPHHKTGHGVRKKRRERGPSIALVCPFVHSVIVSCCHCLSSYENRRRKRRF